MKAGSQPVWNILFQLLGHCLSMPFLKILIFLIKIYTVHIIMRVNAPPRSHPWLPLESLVQPTCLLSSLYRVHQDDPEVL